MLNDYDSREISLVQSRLREIERASLADRRAAQADYLDSMRIRGRVAERISWILDGHYGHGEMLVARRIASKPRMNRVAALAHLVAAFDHGCPVAMAAKAWHALTKREQTALQRECERAIADYERTQADVQA